MHTKINIIKYISLVYKLGYLRKLKKKLFSYITLNSVK